MRWRIYYDDGPPVDSADCAAEAAPVDGVQAIVEWQPNGNIAVLWGADYYWWTGDCWAHGRLSSLERWLRLIAPGVKFGRFARNTVYEQIMREVDAARVTVSKA